MFEGRAEDVVRDISNVKQEIISYRKIIKPERSTLRAARAARRSASCPRISTSTSTTSSTPPSGSGTSSTTTRRSSRGSSDTNESVISHRQNDVLRILTVFSVDPAPADAHLRHLRDERRLPGLRHRRGVLGDHRRDGRHRRRPGRRSSATSAGSSTHTGLRPQRAVRPHREHTCVLPERASAMTQIQG